MTDLETEKPLSKHQIYCRAYYKKNKRPMLERMKRYRKKNAASISKKQKSYRGRNKEKMDFLVTSWCKRNRPRKLLYHYGYSGKSAEKFVDLYKNGCTYCGSHESLQVDHKFPRSRGGGNEISNLQWLCSKCNLTKNSRTEDEFFEYMKLVLSRVSA